MPRLTDPDGDESVLSVVALGVVCELEDLTKSYTPPEEEDDCPVPATEGAEFVFCAGPEWMMEEQRKRSLDSGHHHFCLEEFADMSNGCRVIYKDDRGWYGRYWESGDSPWELLSGRALTKQTMLVLEPDDDRLWINEVVNELARVCDADIDRDSVQAAPFRVEFGPLLQQALQIRKPPLLKRALQLRKPSRLQRVLQKRNAPS